MGVQHSKLLNLFLKACFWPLKILFLRTVTPTKRRQGILLPQQWWDGRLIPSRASPRLLLTQTSDEFLRCQERKDCDSSSVFIATTRLLYEIGHFFLSRTYSLILSTQQEVYKRKLVKLTQFDCEGNQRPDFGNGKETRCSTCTYFKS